MRVALLDTPSASPWSDAPHRLAPLADALERLGHKAIEVLPCADEADPILTGWGREGDVLPLISATRLLRAIERIEPDVCIAPFAGGAAHSLLMARACRELRFVVRVFLVVEPPSRAKLLRGDLMEDPLAPLVADAMERFCLSHADGLLHYGRDAALADIEALGGHCRPFDLGALVSLASSVVLAPGVGEVSKIVFLGAFDRAVVPFIDAVERLASGGLMETREVVFAGPITDAHQGPGKQWLGRRALQWSFPFRTEPTRSFREAMAIATAPGTVAFAPELSTAASALIEDGRTTNRLASDARHSGHKIADALEAALRGVPTSSASPSPRRPDASALAALFEKHAALAAPIPCSLSVCILHYERPDLLTQAVTGVLDQIEDETTEIVVADNGSSSAASEAGLARLSAMPRVRVERLGRRMPIPAAMNRLAALARGSFLVFFDDDNRMVPGGLAALKRACSGNAFDVIASALDVFDADRGTPEDVVATLTFIGPALTAGLFFNALGDTCTAFRRSAWDSLGGYMDPGGPYPSADWILMARAQAAGLRIGVLQRPAFRYRRDIQKADVHWQKFDQHGLRRLVLQHYGGRYDPELLAKLSQSLMIGYG